MATILVGMIQPTGANDAFVDNEYCITGRPFVNDDRFCSDDRTNADRYAWRDRHPAPIEQRRMVQTGPTLGSRRVIVANASNGSNHAATP